MRLKAASQKLVMKRNQRCLPDAKARYGRRVNEGCTMDAGQGADQGVATVGGTERRQSESLFTEQKRVKGIRTARQMKQNEGQKCRRGAVSRREKVKEGWWRRAIAGTASRLP